MRGEARRGELSTLRQDGTIGYQTFSANPVLDDDRVVGIEGFLVDITAWKTAEEEKRRTLQQANKSIAEAEAHYRLMFNSVSDAVFVHKFGEDGRPSCFLEVNDNACRLLGYTREKLLQMRVADIIAPEEHFNVSANAKRFLADGHATWEGRFAAQDCRRIPVEVNARVFNLDGSPTIISSVRDISERKRAESTIQQAHEAIIKAERHYRLMFNSVSDAVFVHTLGEDGVPSQFIEVNDNACHYLGFTREDLLGMGPFDILAPEDFAATEK
jgi:PAS domain S-box-containing protein